MERIKSLNTGALFEKAGFVHDLVDQTENGKFYGTREGKSHSSSFNPDGFSEMEISTGV